MPLVRMRDVAERAGVSVKTVSNVVNGTGVVTEHTRHIVEEALSALQYRVNATARQLRSGKSGIIAVALPHLAEPYFAELASELVSAADRRSITLLLNETGGRAAAERAFSEGSGLPATDGLILSPQSSTTDDLNSRSNPSPLVVLGERDGESRYPHVTIENESVAHTATAFLISRGRTRIAVIGTEKTQSDTSSQRLAGYQRALDEAGLRSYEGLRGDVAEYSRAEGRRAAHELLARGVAFDAVFCFSDLLAIGALRAFQEAGVTVPEQIAVLGVDDIDEGTFTSPSLSTVTFSKRLIAETALDLLLDSSTEPQELGRTAVIAHSILERESTP